MLKEHKTNFHHAMLRMCNAGIDSDSLHQVFLNLKKSADEAQTESAALTLGFSDDREIKAGDYIPTITLSVVKVSNKHAKEAVEHVKARIRAEQAAHEEHKAEIKAELKVEDTKL